MGNVMIDIETLGQNPGCRVVQIGVVRFLLNEIGEIEDALIVNIDQTDPDSLMFEKDPVTERWWHDQSHLVKETWHVPEVIGLGNALDLLGSFLRSNDTVWAKPPQFDLSILRECYKRMEKKNPWHWRQEACARTLYISLPPTGRAWVQDQMRDKRIGWIEHFALDDAKEQALSVQLCVDWNRRRTW